jgi:putative DNA primase/helicase
VIGRTEPSPRTVELYARLIFGVEVAEIEPDAEGHVRYPMVTRGIRMRDDRGVPVQGPQHPDARVEIVRWAICEAELIQAIGRGRGVRRTAENLLQIDILTNVVLPIVVDEVTTWGSIQPSLARVMWARSAVPLACADMAMAYQDLFRSGGHAAQMALRRENPSQTSIEKYLLDICDGFSRIDYRRSGSRGPGGVLLYDPRRVDPVTWLEKHLRATVTG